MNQGENEGKQQCSGGVTLNMQRVWFLCLKVQYKHYILHNSQAENWPASLLCHCPIKETQPSAWLQLKEQNTVSESIGGWKSRPAWRWCESQVMHFHGEKTKMFWPISLLFPQIYWQPTSCKWIERLGMKALILLLPQPLSLHSWSWWVITQDYCVVSSNHLTHEQQK
jgi:hypothetical protein